MMVESRLRCVKPFDLSIWVGEIAVGTVYTPADVVDEGFFALVHGICVSGVGC